MKQRAYKPLVRATELQALSDAYLKADFGISEHIKQRFVDFGQEQDDESRKD